MTSEYARIHAELAAALAKLDEVKPTLAATVGACDAHADVIAELISGTAQDVPDVAAILAAAGQQCAAAVAAIAAAQRAHEGRISAAAGDRPAPRRADIGSTGPGAADAAGSDTSGASATSATDLHAASERERNTLWQNMSEAEREAAFRTDRTIGNLDGLPANDRDRFNRRYLAELRVEAQQLEDELRRSRWNPFSAMLRRTVTRRIAGLEQVANQIQRRGRLLLSIDDVGRGAISIGDPDQADYVATLVPGTTANLATMDGDVQRAQNLFDAARSSAGAQSVAVVAWYGYHAPRTLAHAAFSRYARAGAPRLQAFMRGLRAGNSRDALLTVIGHSYGTTTIGWAANDSAHPLEAGRLVLLGSPGTSADSAADLHFGGDESAVFVATNAGDPIDDFARPNLVHGRLPGGDFGGRTMQADATSPWSVAIHSGYLRRDPALTQTALVMTGRQPADTIEDYYDAASYSTDDFLPESGLLSRAQGAVARLHSATDGFGRGRSQSGPEIL